MRASVIISALVAVLVGFGSSVAIVIAAADAVGATQAQTSSWIAVLCVSMALTTAVLSIRHRMPIVTAWSTPGAALISTTTGLSINMAVGAFLICAVLLLLTAAIKPLGRLVERIPTGIAAAILAGVLFSFVLGIITHATAMPMLGAPLIVIFFVMRLFSPSWAVLVVVVVGFVLAHLLGLAQPVGGFQMSRFTWVAPEFDIAAIIGLALPLYLVTMASQNLPGFAVLAASGYVPPGRSIIALTGLASLLTAPFAAHTTSLAAITASICTGPDAHPDASKRWLGGPVYALGYGVLAIFGASLVSLIASVPAALIGIIAGVALLGPFVNSARLVFTGNGDATAAAAAFVVTASGFSVFGVGAAFWGLVVGLGLHFLTYLRRGAG